MKPAHRPPTVSLAAEVTSRDLTAANDGGWTYPAIAQLYKTVNDRLLYFLPGSGTKTIQERVPRRAIKIESGHPGVNFGDPPDVSTVLGFVHSAEERQSAMRYVGFISRVEEETAQKLSDGTITENSIVLVIMERAPEPKVVEIDAIPEVARPFVSINKDGKALVTAIRQYRWEAVGLVSASSQDFNAILGPPTMVGAAASLAVGRSHWDGALALSSLQAWGKQNPAKLSQAHLAQWYAPDGELVLAGQVAAPDDRGALVVNIDALGNALCDVRNQLETSVLSAEAKEETWSAASRQASACAKRLRDSLTPLLADGKPQPGAAESAPESGQSIALATAEDDPVTAAATSQEPAGPTMSPTVGSEEADTESVKIAHQDLMRRFEVFEVRYQRVAHESASTSRGSTREGASSRG